VTAKVPELRNVGHPAILRTKSYHVRVPVGKVKHGFADTFDPVFVIFPLLDRAHSFTIDYHIHAANMPDPAEGQLHVIVTRA
jgi:hypothetical protein